MILTRTVTPCNRWIPRWRTAPPPAGERLPILVERAGQRSATGPARRNRRKFARALQLISEFDHSPMAGMVELQHHQCGRAGNSPGHHQPGRADHFFPQSFRRAIAPLAADLRSISRNGAGPSPGWTCPSPTICRCCSVALNGAPPLPAAPARQTTTNQKENMFDSSSIIVGLEIGTSKICAVVGEINAAGNLEHHRRRPGPLPRRAQGRNRRRRRWPRRTCATPSSRPNKWPTSKSAASIWASPATIFAASTITASIRWFRPTAKSPRKTCRTWSRTPRPSIFRSTTASFTPSASIFKWTTRPAF